MPLVIIQRKNLSCPALLCDHCGLEIETADKGNYEWRMEATSGAASHLYFTHKRCSYAFEKAQPDSQSTRFLWGTMELSCLLVYLARSLDVDMDEAEELANEMASL